MELYNKYLIEAESAKAAIKELANQPLGWVETALAEAKKDNNINLQNYYRELREKIKKSVSGMKVSEDGQLFKLTEEGITRYEDTFYYVDKVDGMYVIEVYKRSRRKEKYSCLK